MMSPVYVDTHMNMSQQNSVVIKDMHEQCVSGGLSPPPPLHLGTRLISTVAIKSTSYGICDTEIVANCKPNNLLL